MDPVTKISGTLRVGEASATAGLLARKIQGRTAIHSLGMLGLIFAGFVVGRLAGFLLGDGSAAQSSLGGAIGVFLGLCIFLAIRLPLAKARFQRNFQSRQHTLDLPFRIEISAEHLLYEVGGLTQLARWSAVDQLFLSHGYWIFMAQNYPTFAPLRCFATVDDEKRFVAEAVAHMSAEARSRSGDAVRFAESKA